MMINDQERRAVAKRLRALDVHEWYDGMDEVDSLEEAIGCSISQDWQDMVWWHRLADLIDRPTCHNVSGCDDVFKCSDCGAEFEPLAVNGNEYGDVFYTPFQPRYCPNCGAYARSGDE